MPVLRVAVECGDTRPGEIVGVAASWTGWRARDDALLDGRGWPRWTGALPLPDAAPAALEYKYVIVEAGRITRWEHTPDGRNRTVPALPDDGAPPLDDGAFGRPPRRPHPPPNGASAAPPHAAPAPPAHENHADAPLLPEATGELDRFEKALVDMNANERSWRLRLSFVRSVFSDKDVAHRVGFSPTDLHCLVTVSAYLTFLATGQVECHEDHGHHRPNHHAMEARKIEEALDALFVDDDAAGGGECVRGPDAWAPYVARSIYPQLPSHSSQFTVSVPLTRIRDIAHRGDIPHDLKQEIKHTLQNKLHRCAGPEDLKTCENILNRVRGGGYSGDFVHQLTIFYDELREFFNASSLDDRLRFLGRDAVRGYGKAGVAVADSAAHLLGLKSEWKPAMDQLSVLTSLRQKLVGILGENRASADDENTGEKKLEPDVLQKIRLADCELDTYAFTLLAGVAKTVEESKLDSDGQWRFALRGLGFAMRNMEASFVLRAESRAAASEVEAILGEPKLSMLRVKAAVDRCRRTSEDFSTAISEAYTRRVASLSSALSVDRRAASVFAEAVVRSTVAFQCSRIADKAVKRARVELGIPPWDSLFDGTAKGKLLFVESLGAVEAKGNDAVIAVCKTADGDEDIPPFVKGVILGHALPHLSHLGVRARQSGVVFVCAEDASLFEEVWSGPGRQHKAWTELSVSASKGLAGLTECNDKKVASESPKKQPVEIRDTHTPEKSPKGRTKTSPKNSPKAWTELSVSASKGLADLTKCDDKKVASESPKKQSVEIRDIDTSNKSSIGLSETTPKNSSAKCSFAGRLEVLAKGSKGLFSTPEGVCLPFGVFERARKPHSEEIDALAKKYETAMKSSEVEASKIAREIRELIMKSFSLEKTVTDSVQQAFSDKDTRVMVRSSANCEDLEEMSGAGLYDTIANVPVGDAAALTEAVIAVWSSLWTRRAASSRSSYGVPHKSASMAILIQRMVPAEAAFVSFSHNPVDVEDSQHVYMEVAVGMGETLASGAIAGQPYRFRVDREDVDSVTVDALASYGDALVPSSDKEDKSSGLRRLVVDYSTQRLTTDSKLRLAVATRVAKVMLFLEKELDGAQDVEGVLNGLEKAATPDEVGVFIVQARPQIKNA